MRLALGLFTLASFLRAVDDPLAALRAKHPRLIATDDDLARVRKLMDADPTVRALYQKLTQEADDLAAAPSVEYKLAGPRLLAQSRLCLDRVYKLALLFRLTNQARYRDRAVKELRAAADFPDWNPSHFLDTAEMTHAFAIGYDWLYPALTGAERAWMRDAVVRKGFDPALAVYEKGKGWPAATHNWNQVCNGGIGIGALAFADEEPERARRILRFAAASLPLAMASYAPDGGWNEGPGYWHYATRYTVYFLAALRTALGHDFGLSDSPGFERAGHFRVYFSSPTGRTFNYADAGDRAGTAAEMFWLARRFKEPVYSWHERVQLEQARAADALSLVWYEPKQQTAFNENWPLDTAFGGVETAFLRGAWNDPGAFYFAIKGGDNQANHSHLDLGTFVLDSGGVRWATDLGVDDYNLPQYFGKLRWSYYRLRTESHNTVLIDNENQDRQAAAAVTGFSSERECARVTIDLSAAYPQKLKRWTRTAELLERNRILLRDHIEASQPVDALWGMVTEAAVSLQGRRARLAKDGRTLAAEILAPADARFDTVSTRPPEPQNPNEGTRKLVVRLPGKIERTEIVVTLK